MMLFRFEIFVADRGLLMTVGELIHEFAQLVGRGGILALELGKYSPHRSRKAAQKEPDIDPASEEQHGHSAQNPRQGPLRSQLIGQLIFPLKGQPQAFIRQLRRSRSLGQPG